MRTYILLSLALITLVSCTKTVTPPADPEAYYNDLKASCGDNRCCLTSVIQMKNQGATEMKDSCPAGTQENMLKCETSKKWCEKVEMTGSGN